MQQADKREQVLHLWQVEKLSIRQIAKELKMCRKRIRKMIEGTHQAKSLERGGILDPYAQLISHWYSQHPKLKAIQIYERLKEYGYSGSYVSVARESREYRRPKQTAYYPLTFVPGEEAQVDWFFYNDERLGMMAGFVYVLAYSRYAWGVFYLRHSFEFFLAGHEECFKHIGGLAHRHRYDNLKSVVLKRSPVIEYNPQFLDFARFYGFSIHACNPYSGNEKGRVERLIRDIRVFLYGETFVDLADLNRKFHVWLETRNATIHRSTGKTPNALLKEERLLGLPEHPYPTSRVIISVVSKTALVEFETNKYSVPSSYAGKPVEIAAYPGYIEIYQSEQKIAIHSRCFGHRQMIQNPLHAEKLLNRTPQFKMQRIVQLINDMDPVFKDFIDNQENEIKRADAAYQLFTVLKTHSKAILISAVRELNTLHCYKTKALLSLLHLPAASELAMLWPQNQELLNLKYKERDLNDYDPDSTNLGTT